MASAQLLATILAIAAAPPPDASTREQRRLAHQVDQALLYVDMKLPGRAREQLEQLVAVPPGETDPMAWLALARALYEEQRLDEAGTAVRRAQGLGVANRLGEKKWARNFYRRFQNNVGGLRVWADDCPKLKITSGLAVPIVDRERRALLESTPGWRSKALERPSNTVFFLPKGTYKLGEARVQIIPGEDTSISNDELAAECAAPPAPTAVGKAGTQGSGAEDATAVVGAPSKDEGLLSSPWFWVAVGAAVAAGGATAAIVATQGGEPDRFRQVF